MNIRLFITLITSVGIAVQASAASAPAAPPTSKVDAVSAYWGVTVHDPYRWLEDGSSPAVSRWIDTQNAYAEKILASVPIRRALAARIRQLSITSTIRFNPKIVAGKLFYFRLTPPQEQAVLVVQPWPVGRARVLVDPNTEGHGLEAIADFWPSPDGRLVAYGTATAGSEDTQIHILDIARAKRLSDAVPHLGPQPTLAWINGDGGFIYARPPQLRTLAKNAIAFDYSLFRHRLGTPVSQDRPELGQGFARVAEWWLTTSADGRRIAALVVKGDGPPSYVFLREANKWIKALMPQAGVPSWELNSAVLAFSGSRVLAVATGGSPRGRIVSVARNGPRTLVPEASWTKHAITPIAGGFLVTEVRGPDWRVRQFDNAGGFVRTLALPQTGVGINDVVGEPDSPVALVAYQGWTLSARWALYDARSGALRQIFAVRPPADYSGIAVTRSDAIEPDGTRVPVTVLARRGALKNGRNPAILTAYGAYGATSAPEFLGDGLAWIERGGVLALANIRGGGEFGEAWHRAGALTNERNRFADLNAAAEALIRSGWTSPQHLGITGGSAGGFLMGGALTTRPELYRAVVSFVGIYDWLRTELSPNGEYNVTEFGTVKHRDEFRAMYAGSPLLRVHDGAAYPAILLITGENDPRVEPWQSRKFAARLQAATSSGLPVAVLTRRAFGHGVGESFSQRLGNEAAQLIFFAGELGLRSNAVKR